MRYKLFFLLTFLAKISFAQEAPAASERQAVVKPATTVQEYQPKLIKNPNATDITVNGVVIDQRAVKYYPEGALREVSAEKARKINFIYLESYEPEPESFSALTESCKARIASTFDVGAYSQLRDMTERRRITVDLDGCRFDIFLFSHEEIINYP